MNRWLMAKIFHLIVAPQGHFLRGANFGNRLAITCNLRLDLKDFIAPSIRPRINQMLLNVVLI